LAAAEPPASAVREYLTGPSMFRVRFGNSLGKSLAFRAQLQYSAYSTAARTPSDRPRDDPDKRYTNVVPYLLDGRVSVSTNVLTPTFYRHCLAVFPVYASSRFPYEMLLRDSTAYFGPADSSSSTKYGTDVKRVRRYRRNTVNVFIIRSRTNRRLILKYRERESERTRVEGDGSHGCLLNRHKILFNGANQSGNRTPGRWFLGIWTGSSPPPREEQFEERDDYDLNRKRSFGKRLLTE